MWSDGTSICARYKVGLCGRFTRRQMFRILNDIPSSSLQPRIGQLPTTSVASAPSTFSATAYLVRPITRRWELRAWLIDADRLGTRAAAAAAAALAAWAKVLSWLAFVNIACKYLSVKRNERASFRDSKASGSRSRSAPGSARAITALRRSLVMWKKARPPCWRAVCTWRLSDSLSGNEFKRA